MTELSDVAAIVTAAVAMYAGVLSTYNFIDKRRERQPRLRLGYRPGVFDIRDGRANETTINLEVANIGTKPVQITSHSNVQVQLPNSKYMIPMERWESADFPCVLQPGSSLTVYRNMREFAESLKKNGLSGEVRFRVICHDGAGRVYRGKKLPFDIESWSKSGQA